MSAISKLSKNLFATKSGFHSPKTLERKPVEHFLHDSLDIIFPGMLRKKFKNSRALATLLNKHVKDLKKFLTLLKTPQNKVDEIAKHYLENFVLFSTMVKKDAQAILDGDPAADSIEEVLLCYPGLFAIAVHRLAHFYYSTGQKVFARFMSEIAHEKTGIDIHPGANIGEYFCIDHGTGVVIGETAHIGNYVKIYQGVTLGALSVDKSQSQTKRHPTIEDHCVLYSQATILGGTTVIGHDSVIGGNVWMTKSVPPYSLVYHKSEVRLDQKKNLLQPEELTYEI